MRCRRRMRTDVLRNRPERGGKERNDEKGEEGDVRGDRDD